ncbi:hypothetical protein QYZ44_04810 [Vibrio parahaemolyticus]|nr:hypothetical protein [Vibrio parahaemolyticus]MDN4709245.1 hypothetical protein [Vibrio parahaemolyticus]MDN4734507.1 hypothetical protein [Vibrio parahaemolyticus]
MRQVSLALILLTTLAGCQLTNVEGEIDDVKVKVSTNDDNHGPHGNGSFCPLVKLKRQLLKRLVYRFEANSLKKSGLMPLFFD